MGDLFLLLFNTAIINNLALTYLVGIDLQVAASQRISTAWLMGLATIYCLSFCLPGAYLINQLIIIPFNLQYIDLLLYVMMILLIVLTSKNIVHRLFPLLIERVDSITPVLLVNSLFIAVILLQESKINSFIDSFLFGFATGLGFLFLLLVVTCLRERVKNENIPEPFRGIPILLIAIGILSMGLMGLAGLQ
jgi:H+/Na+-translocating ferredoxin:NAD+ oxidoreductase subunit A